MVLCLSGQQVKSWGYPWSQMSHPRALWRSSQVRGRVVSLDILIPFSLSPDPVNYLVAYNLLTLSLPRVWTYSKAHTCQPSTRHSNFLNHIALGKSAAWKLCITYTGCGLKPSKSRFVTHSNPRDYSFYFILKKKVNQGQYISGLILTSLKCSLRFADYSFW